MADRQPSGLAMGWISFAGFMMILGGSLKALHGLSAIINPDYFPQVDYLLEQKVSTWGWWTLLVGAVLILSGIAVFSGNVLARTVGVIAALISAISMFAWFSYQPIWATLVIFIDISVIWALTAHGRDIQKASEGM